MKSFIRKRLVGVALILALTCFLGVTSAQAGLVAKVKHFVFFIDQSGSMYMHHDTLHEVKMVMAKRLIKGISQLIPDWDYTGALYLYAPFEEIQAPETYDQDKFARSFSKIKDEQEIFGRMTPLGAGLRALDHALANQSGETAVIMISDGEANQERENPFTELMRFRIDHLDCRFYVISFAEGKKDRAFLENFAKAANGTLIEASDLLDKDYAIQEFVNDVFLEEIPDKPPAPRVISVPGLRAVSFGRGGSEVSAEVKSVLDEDIAILRSYGDDPIVLEGHTDSKGSDERNQVLSERRAFSVRDYLTGRGISKDRIKTIGYGMLKPVATNDTEAGRALNRRVEIKVVK